MKPTLSIIGAGRVGLCFAKLFQQHDCFDTIAVCNRSFASAEKAIAIIGQGAAVLNYEKLPSSEIYLLTTPDDVMADVVQGLKVTRNFNKKSLVFHCSGTLSVDVLCPLQELGCLVASVHPVKSFAESLLACQTFSGTACGLEGDEKALAILEPVLLKLGAKIFSLEDVDKLKYHAATVMASNYLVTLIDTALSLYQEAGLASEQALSMVKPILQGTLDNSLRRPTHQALTGPIARGDWHVVEQQLLAIKNHKSHSVYKSLGLLTLDLAQRQGSADDKALEKIKKFLLAE